MTVIRDLHLDPLMDNKFWSSESLSLRCAEQHTIPSDCCGQAPTMNCHV